MKKENVNFIVNRISKISDQSLELLKSVKDKDLDIYNKAYKINQTAHELNAMINKCSTE